MGATRKPQAGFRNKSSQFDEKPIQGRSNVWRRGLSFCAAPSYWARLIERCIRKLETYG
jgi:hypothetical protein